MQGAFQLSRTFQDPFKRIKRSLDLGIKAISEIAPATVRSIVTNVCRVRFPVPLSAILLTHSRIQPSIIRRLYLPARTVFYFDHHISERLIKKSRAPLRRKDAAFDFQSGFTGKSGIAPRRHLSAFRSFFLTLVQLELD